MKAVASATVHDLVLVMSKNPLDTRICLDFQTGNGNTVGDEKISFRSLLLLGS